MARTESGNPHLALQNLWQRGALYKHGSLLDGIRALERSGIQIAFVQDEHRRLIGLITDGDIRRALLSGADLSSPIGQHYARDYVWVDPSAGRAEVLELMQSRSIRHVPILDRHGHMLGIHLLSHLLTHQTRTNPVVILAGGKGTRLLPLTLNVPKPMLRVAGRPILERLLLHLMGNGLRRFFLSVHYLAEQIQEYFGDGERLGCSIEYLLEEKPLGTGGPLTLLPPGQKEPILIVNGDLLTQANVGNMLDSHAEHGYVATVGVGLYHHKIPYGCVETTEGKVVALIEKPSILRTINAGIYVLNPEVIEEIPRDTDYPITQLIEGLMAGGREVGAYEISDDWIDVGQNEELRKAREGV